MFQKGLYCPSSPSPILKGSLHNLKSWQFPEVTRHSWRKKNLSFQPLDKAGNAEFFIVPSLAFHPLCKHNAWPLRRRIGRKRNENGRKGEGWSDVPSFRSFARRKWIKHLSLLKLTSASLITRPKAENRTFSTVFSFSLFLLFPFCRFPLFSSL